MNRLALLAIPALLATCTPPAIPALPTQGGPAWLELTSEHFIIWTDSSPEQAQRLLHVVEQLRQVIFGVSFFNPSSNSRTFVVAFRNAEEVHAYAPSQFLGYAWPPGNPMRQPVIVVPADALDDAHELLTHEMTHVISYNALHVQPHWFAEGLASYFETTVIDEAHGSVDVGMPARDRLRGIRRTGLLPTATLFTCSEHACMDHRFYATAWAVFAYLVDQRLPGLITYMQRLTNATPDSFARIWSEVFPDLVPEKLDREIAHWIAYGRSTVRHYNVKFETWPATQRPLVDADVEAARGLIHFLFDQTGPLPPEITHALQLDPTHVIARIVELGHTRSVGRDVAHAVAAAHPDDWRAWWLVGFAEQSGPDAQAAHAKVCELVAKNPAVLPPRMCPN